MGDSTDVLKDMEHRDPLAEEALRLAKEQGILRPRDLEEHEIPRRYASLLAHAGLLRRVGRGLYVHPDTPMTENHSFALVGKRAPEAVICLLSALRFHEITTQIPSEVWIAVHPKSRPPQISELSLRVVRFSGPALNEGFETHEIEGVLVRITSVAKTVADCFKYRNKIGRDVAVEALRDALNNHRTSVSEIARYAGICRVTQVLRPYLEIYQ